MLKAIFWDNDGVLVDTEHLYFRATQRVLAEIGVELTEAQYVELFLVRSVGGWHLAEARGFSPQEVEALRLKRNALYGKLLHGAHAVIPGVPEVLQALHGRYRMGIVTSSAKEHFDIIHAASGLLRYFDFVLTRGDYHCSKPHPEPYLKAIAHAGVAPDECIVVEDSERGLAAATAAGLRCIVVPSQLTSGCAFAGADRVLTDIGELPQILRKHPHSTTP
jgi:HAD superfamily hydrolase (TIGR01509 family)